VGDSRTAAPLTLCGVHRRAALVGTGAVILAAVLALAEPAAADVDGSITITPSTVAPGGTAELRAVAQATATGELPTSITIAILQAGPVIGAVTIAAVAADPPLACGPIENFDRSVTCAWNNPPAAPGATAAVSLTLRATDPANGVWVAVLSFTDASGEAHAVPGASATLSATPPPTTLPPPTTSIGTTTSQPAERPATSPTSVRSSLPPTGPTAGWAPPVALVLCLLGLLLVSAAACRRAR